MTPLVVSDGYIYLYTKTNKQQSSIDDMTNMYTIYSGASLIRIIHLFGHLFGNQSPFLNRKWLTYPEIQLSEQSVWERRCPDKWGSTVL